MPLGRLVTETRDSANGSDAFGTRETGDYSDAYTLDFVANRMLKVRGWDTDGDGALETGEPKDSVTAYSYNSRDQLLAEGPDADADGQPDTATATTYAYDDNGSQITKAAGGATTRYAWDLHSRMAGIDANNDGDTNDAGDTRYAYNSRGVRVAESSAGKTTAYLNDSQNPTGYTKAIEEHTDSNGDGVADEHRSYIIGHQVIAQKSGSDLYYFIVDGHGSTRAITPDGVTLRPKKR